MWGVSHADLSTARWQELSDESAASVARVIAREPAAADDPRVQNLMTGARPGGGAMTFGPDGML